MLAPKCVWFPVRYLVACECSISLAINYMVVFCLSMAIMSMTKIHEMDVDGGCGPIGLFSRNLVLEFSWTERQQVIIHGSFFWGFFISCMVGGHLADLFNHKLIMITGMLAICVFAAITPIVTRLWDFFGLIACRALMGLAAGVFYSGMLSVLAVWAIPLERGAIGALVFSGMQIGNALNTIITGYLLSINWTLPFYVHSAAGIFMAVLIFATMPSNPGKLKHLSNTVTERRLFLSYRTHLLDKEKAPKMVPLHLIIKNKHVWAIFMASFSHGWHIFAIIIFLPIYMKVIIKLNITQIAHYNFVFFFAMWIISITSGFICDLINRKKLISLTYNRKIFCLIGSILPALSFFFLPFVNCNETLTILCLNVGSIFTGLYYSSVFVNPIDLSPNYAATIGSMAQIGFCAAAVLAHYLFDIIIIDNNDISYKTSWTLYFWISSILIIVGGVVYFFLSSAEEQAFNNYYAEFLRPASVRRANN